MRQGIEEKEVVFISVTYRGSKAPRFDSILRYSGPSPAMFPRHQSDCSRTSALGDCKRLINYRMAFSWFATDEVKVVLQSDGFASFAGSGVPNGGPCVLATGSSLSGYSKTILANLLGK